MPDLSRLFDRNRAWADRMAREKPGFFSELVAQQTPEYLWIGCSDSRVPANEIVDLLPGELFVHRNIANQVIHTDLNVLTVVHYAVEHLKVDHIIVSGDLTNLGLPGEHAAALDWLTALGAPDRVKIGRAHVLTPVTDQSRMPSSA